MPSQNVSLPVALEALLEEMLLLVEYAREVLQQKKLVEKQMHVLKYKFNSLNYAHL